MQDIEKIRKIIIDELSAMLIVLGAGAVLYDLERAYTASLEELIEIADEYSINLGKVR